MPPTRTRFYPVFKLTYQSRSSLGVSDDCRRVSLSAASGLAGGVLSKPLPADPALRCPPQNAGGLPVGPQPLAALERGAWTVRRGPHRFRGPGRLRPLLPGPTRAGDLQQARAACAFDLAVRGPRRPAGPDSRLEEIAGTVAGPAGLHAGRVLPDLGGRGPGPGPRGSDTGGGLVACDPVDDLVHGGTDHGPLGSARLRPRLDGRRPLSAIGGGQGPRRSVPGSRPGRARGHTGDAGSGGEREKGRKGEGRTGEPFLHGVRNVRSLSPLLPFSPASLRLALRLRPARPQALQADSARLPACPCEATRAACSIASARARPPICD